MKEFFLNLLFPSFCFNCQREGNFLCSDCLALIDVSAHQYCPFCNIPKIVLDGKTCSSCKKRGKKLSGLFCAASYQNSIIKKVISQFKYEPYVKTLSKTLAKLIITHFQLLDYNPPTTLQPKPTHPKSPDFANFKLAPIPLDKKKLKQRGFNQATEIAKDLSKFLKAPLLSDVLIKIKKTPDQVELTKKEREENIKGAFSCQKPELVKGEKILLVDDIFTTGATLEEAAQVLKRAEAKEIWGVVVARG